MDIVGGGEEEGREEEEDGVESGGNEDESGDVGELRDVEGVRRMTTASFVKEWRRRRSDKARPTSV